MYKHAHAQNAVKQAAGNSVDTQQSNELDTSQLLDNRTVAFEQRKLQKKYPIVPESIALYGYNDR